MNGYTSTLRKTTPRATLTPCLLLLAACSHGADTGGPQPAPPGPDLAAADPQAPPDLRPLRPGFLQPRWVWTLQGGLALHGPYLTPLPAGGELGTADVLVTFQRGYETDDLIVGAGDPGEALVRGKYAPVLTWLDGRDGGVRRVRQVAGNAPDRPGVADPLAPASAAPGGDLVVTGSFANGVVFNPGTAAAQQQSTEARLYDGASLLAWDPYLARYAADGTPRWLSRGRTPGPLVKSWFNYGEGVAALPDGAAVIAGGYDGSGFVLGDGRGSRTFSGGAGSYVARVVRDTVVWAVRSSGPLHYWRGVHAAPDGALYVYGQQGGDVVFGADSFKLPLPMAASGSADALIKLGPGGDLRWVRRLVGAPGLSGVLSLAVAPDGDLLIAGTASGGLTLRDEGDAVLAVVPQAPRSEFSVFAARLSADGAPRFVMTLGFGLERGFAVAPAPGGDTWLLARAARDIRTVQLDGGNVVLLDDVAPGSRVNVLYRLSATGRRTAAYALGTNLDAVDLAALPDGAVAVAGGYSRNAQDVRIGDGAGGTRALPPNTSPTDDRLVVMVLRP